VYHTGTSQEASHSRAEFDGVAKSRALEHGKAGNEMEDEKQEPIYLVGPLAF
jgi:hypothetical protein